jgi:hypothetical protein
MMKVLSSSETSVLTRAARRNIPEDAILHSHHRENLKSYIGTICSKFRYSLYAVKGPENYSEYCYLADRLGFDAARLAVTVLQLYSRCMEVGVCWGEPCKLC